MKRGRWGTEHTPLSPEVLWKCSKEPHHPSNPSVIINAFTSSPSPPRRWHSDREKLGYNPALQCLQDFNQARARLKRDQSKEAQKLEHKYNAQQMKMERRHEQEWARMAWEGDYTFQEVFSMTSSVKLLPWCISSGIPLGYMDDVLAAAT